MSKKNNHVCTLLAVGDIMLHGKIAEKIKKTSDFGFPFRKIQHPLKDKHILFGNLETMISKQTQPAPGTPGKYFSLPGTGRMLREMGFDVLNVGHNHLYDWGAEGVETTMTELKSAGIQFAGVGKNFDKAGKPAVLSCPQCNKRFGFLCYTSTYNTLKKNNAYVGRPPNKKNFKKDIEKLKKITDLIVVSIHGGACLNYWPSPAMLALCRSAVDCGANIVLGHHPHVMNGIEEYKDCLIVYSLPDIIRPVPFDEDEVYASMKKDQYESFILNIEISSQSNIDYKIKPCILDLSLQTRPASQKESDAIQKNIYSLSQDIVTGQSTAKHFDVIKRDFREIYGKSLWRAFKKGGAKWLWLRLKTLKPYHLKILFTGMFSKFRSLFPV